MDAQEKIKVVRQENKQINKNRQTMDRYIDIYIDRQILDKHRLDRYYINTDQIDIR